MTTPSRDIKAINIFSNIPQLDGGVSFNSTSYTTTNSISNDSDITDNIMDTSATTAKSNYDSEDEIDQETSPINLTPPSKPNSRKTRVLKASTLPMVCVLNARSVYNKKDNLKIFMKELGIEAGIISETWERDELSIEELMGLDNYKVHSYKREKKKSKKQPGGGCAIIYNENRFRASKLDIYVPPGVEACWLLLKPLNPTDLVENIAMAAIYVSPSSKFKTATINHIIDTLHIIRAQYDNKVNFLIGGDLNQLKIEQILDAYGSLRQIISFGTRKSAILEKVITDLHTLYQPPRCLPPLQVDAHSEGKDSDHNIIVLAPILMTENVPRQKRTVKSRPLPESGVNKFSGFITSHTWEEVLKEGNIDQKVSNFHNILKSKLDEFCPEKVVKISYLDKKWMNPHLKNLNRRIKREFFKNRKSQKWKKLKTKYKKQKKKQFRHFIQTLSLN